MSTQQLETVLTNTTHVVAAGAITSPVWLPSLAQISNFAATLTPIFGLIWLTMQMVRAIIKWRQK